MIDMGRRHQTRPEISIAPLVDCVFLLLIFFLLTSSFSRNRAIDITLPASNTATEQTEEIVEIAVSHKGEIEFEGKMVGLEGLTSALKRVVHQRGKQPVLLVADRRVPLEMLTDLIDCIREADLESVAIATRPEQAGKWVAEEATE